MSDPGRARTRTTVPCDRLRWIGALLAIAALLSACSGSPDPGGSSATPTGRSRSPAASPGLDLPGVEALVFANRYADADLGYRSLTAARPSDAAVHASYALFLNYRQQFDTAHREAVAAIGDDPSSARAHAVLSRVEDWTSHLDEAVTEGRRAVALDGSDPLAHLFLSEALADSGDLGGARAEIAAAQLHVDAGTSVYIRAELHREQGNLGYDAGDQPAQLRGFSEAFQIQPGWVERPTELAGAYVAGNDLVGARNAMQKAVDLTPDDADLLLSLGRIAMLQPDYATADATYARLVRLRPSDSTALELAAHALFADRQDLDGAVALLMRALTAGPANEEAAAYLYYLERDVRQDDARGTREIAAAVSASTSSGRPAPPVPDVAGVQADRAARALGALNVARQDAALPPVALDDHLTVSAITHCYYWMFNNGSQTVAKLGIHLETPGLPGYSGATAPARAVNFGWHDGPVGEDITHAGDPLLAVGQWVNSVYHRFAMMRPDLSSIGYGDCAVGPLPMEDMEFGFGILESSRHAPTVYPGQDQSQVPAGFVDNELPDPVPAGRPRTTGYPVSVTFDPSSRVSVSAFTIAGPDGAALETYAGSPDRADGNTAWVLPVAPLHPQTRYAAHVAATVDGVPYQRSWSFMTGGVSPAPTGTPSATP